MTTAREAWAAPTLSPHSASPDNRLGIVVNYFTRFASARSHRVLVASTSASLHLLANNPAVTRVLLVDGSPRSDDVIKVVCEELGIAYYHHGHQISYVRAYNLGWRHLDEPYIGLMANDIIPYPAQTIERLFAWVTRPDIGCAFPYFSSSHSAGGEVQRTGFATRGAITCEPAAMTLNLNLFKRSVLEQVNGLDEKYLYGFAGSILLLKMRSLGFRSVMVGGTHVFHYGKFTKSLGESSLDANVHVDDVRRWFSEYAKYAARTGLANVDVRRWPFATTRRSKLLWSLCRLTPVDSIRTVLMRLVTWLEPHLTRYPARYGKGDRPQTSTLSAQAPSNGV